MKYHLRKTRFLIVSKGENAGWECCVRQEKGVIGLVGSSLTQFIGMDDLCFSQ
jgi:hypothetical protein